MAWRLVARVVQRSLDTIADLYPAVRRSGRQKGERHEVPRALVDAAVGEDLAVVGELQLASTSR